MRLNELARESVGTCTCNSLQPFRYCIFNILDQQASTLDTLIKEILCHGWWDGQCFLHIHWRSRSTPVERVSRSGEILHSWRNRCMNTTGLSVTMFECWRGLPMSGESDPQVGGGVAGATTQSRCYSHPQHRAILLRKHVKDLGWQKAAMIIERCTHFQAWEYLERSWNR